MGPLPYAALNGMIDPAFPKAAHNYWKAQFLADLSDEAIRTLIAGFQECPSPMSHLIIEHFHGAASRVPVIATACPMRVTGFNVVIASQWVGAEETDRCITWARDTFSSFTPYLAPTRYVNYLEDDAHNPAAVAYGPNLSRLRGIKTKYDQRISSGTTSTFSRTDSVDGSKLMLFLTQLVYVYPGKETLRAFSGDGERQRVLHMKNESVRATILVQGTSI